MKIKIEQFSSVAMVTGFDDLARNSPYFTIIMGIYQLQIVSNVAHNLLTIQKMIIFLCQLYVCQFAQIVYKIYYSSYQLPASCKTSTFAQGILCFDEQKMVKLEFRKFSLLFFFFFFLPSYGRVTWPEAGTGIILCCKLNKIHGQIRNRTQYLYWIQIKYQHYVQRCLFSHNS